MVNQREREKVESSETNRLFLTKITTPPLACGSSGVSAIRSLRAEYLGILKDEELKLAAGSRLNRQERAKQSGEVQRFVTLHWKILSEWGEE